MVEFNCSIYDLIAAFRRLLLGSFGGQFVQAEDRVCACSAIIQRCAWLHAATIGERFFRGCLLEQASSE
jgi:hypothetical protein